MTEKRSPAAHQRISHNRNEHKKKSGKKVEQYVRKLLRGETVSSADWHHKAMAHLLGPRPEGMTVSKACPDDCPTGYLGYRQSKSRSPYRLCTNPERYVYESLEDNLSRDQQ